MDKLLDENLKQEALDVKRYIIITGQIQNISDDELESSPVKIAVSVDGSWQSRGWASKSGIVDVAFEGTRKIIDVIIKTSICRICEDLNDKK